MSITRFVHAADLHLDSTFRGLRSADPEVSAILRAATFTAYDNIIDLCLQERVDALLVAGDIYDGKDRSLPAQLHFLRGLRRLDEAGIRSFICHGNHDPLDGWEARLAIPPGCHRFGDDVAAVPIDPAEPHGAVVYGVSFPRQDVRENLARRFRRDPRHLYAIGLLHANVGANTGHEPYAPCTLEDLERAGIDYWALGHVHTRSVLREQDPTVVYPGNSQGLHRNERGARGVYLVDVGDDRRARPSFHPVDVVRWAATTLNIAELDGEQALLDGLEERAAELRDAADGRHVIGHVRITGRGPLHAWLRRPDMEEDLRAHINNAFKGHAPILWCAVLDIESAPPFDREERRQAQDFLGDVLRLVDEIHAETTPPPWLREYLKPFYGQGRVRRFLADDALSDTELLRLLDRAEERCVEAFLADEAAAAEVSE